MQSIDPKTGAAPQDPLAGFLPPDNASKQGEGFVTFTVKPKSGLPNGAVIANQASIVFDVNAPIATNTVTNTIDSVYPTSNVNPLPSTSTSASFTVSWSGSDSAGAGIATYDVYSASDFGPYTAWQSATTATAATFSGAAGHSYSFYSMATDNVGHRQQTAGTVQTTTVSGSSSGLCNVTGDNSTSVADVQLMINEALGVKKASNDLNGDGVVNVLDVQIVIAAALGRTCMAQ